MNITLNPEPVWHQRVPGTWTCTELVLGAYSPVSASIRWEHRNDVIFYKVKLIGMLWEMTIDAPSLGEGQRVAGEWSLRFATQCAQYQETGYSKRV